ncbi:glycosyltransferase family 2 protein [Actinoplanes friuliensis]|jgi:glycosyltransferase involved in cell wall biosynthesis|uniref:Family 2 glycosyl transferase n=1 Tax=Actinoplanes friuliensis DSM 7358 TaxID=1246995 RepID=U5W674_9ACTN|nr:glycosyltransferase family 2 protein [Actinoplanes friuliensis]AGZ44619.1 family 2 glycosyl transferase [Actinoplanes friuliensis DSM 7358]
MPPAPRHDQWSTPSVTVVIPALNEEHNLPLILENLPPVDEVIVVDGRSHDDTVAVAREVRPDVVVIRQTRTGKGNALVCGFAASTSDIIVTLNADGSADPQEIPRFVDALLSGAEVAHGSRFRPGGDHRDAGALERTGHQALSRLVNLFFGTRFTDLSCGYNAYWRALVPALDLPAPDVRGPKRGLAWGEGPEIDTLATIRMAAQGLRVVEVATVGYPRLDGDRPRRVLPAAVRAVRTAYSEYVRRWKIGRRPAPQRRLSEPLRPLHENEPTGRHAARHSVPPPPRDRDGGRRGRRRPDLTVIQGEGRDDRWDGTTHLRAVPGENFRNY